MKKHILLPVLLAASALVWMSIGAFLKYHFLPALDMETEENIVALPFVLVADDEMSYRFSTRYEAKMNPTQPSEYENQATQQQTEPLKETVPTVPEVTRPAVQIQSESQPQTTEPIYMPVDDSWFDDVLFIGESRTDGLKTRGRLGGADYFCEVNETVYGIIYKRSSDRDFYNKRLDMVLSAETYGKVYIHFGINECAGNPDEFAASYQELIDLVRLKQPDAYIILQSIMPVTKNYKPDPIYKPENLERFNEKIRGLVTGDKMFYIDTAEWCAGDDGYLLPELTNDGCHPHGEGLLLWAQWLKTNAGTLGIP